MAVLTRDGYALGRRPVSFVPWHQAIDRLFQDSVLTPSLVTGARSRIASTGTNLWETDDAYVAQVALPGLKQESITVTFEENVLTVKAESAVAPPDGAKAVWQSFGGPVEYRVQLPAEIESAQAEAGYNAGVLTVRLPKSTHARPHTIKVTAK